MSMLLKARRQGGRSAALEASLGLGLGVEQRSRRRLGWLLGLPLCLGLGIGANLAWHWVNLKPQVIRHEIKEPTPLPYGPSETPARFLTRVLPAPPAPVAVEPKGNEADDSGLALDGVSSDLASRFQAAVAAQAQQSNSPAIPEPASGEISGVMPLGDLPDVVARRVPPLNYRSHVFSSDPSKRLVNINGKDCYEGDEVAPGVVLLQILPEGAILRVAGQSFSLEALTDWPGVS